MRPSDKQNAAKPDNAAERRWVLIGRFSGNTSTQMVLDPLPFVIGRRPNVSLTLARPTISGLHAEFFETEAGLFIRDLGSTNGTFVDGRRLEGEMKLEPGCLIQFADRPFHLTFEVALPTDNTACKNVCDHAFALVQFRTMIANSAVEAYFQPIFRLQTGDILAYEVLARSRLAGLETASLMFRAAEELGMHITLSQLVCRKGLETSWALDRPPHLFLNTHPDELSSPDFFKWLEQVREIAPHQPLTIEVHEAAITDVAALTDLRHHLDKLNMGLAFDDFGAGQARIAELAEIRPNHLKFDRRIITGLDQADSSRRRFVQSLIHAVQDLGIVALAEGIETEGEFEVCRDLGFETAQGFFLGHPEPVGSLCGEGNLATQYVFVE